MDSVSERNEDLIHFTAYVIIHGVQLCVVIGEVSDSLVVSGMDCQQRVWGSIPHQKDISKFLIRLRPLANSAMQPWQPIVKPMHYGLGVERKPWQPIVNPFQRGPKVNHCKNLLTRTIMNPN